MHDYKPILRMEDMYKSYGATQALQGVSLHVRRGEVHALLGENGAGKSTLMKILSGAILPDRGEIWLNDRRVRFSNPADAHRNGIRAVYQHFSLFPYLTVAENLVAGNWAANPIGLVNWRKCYDVASEYLESVGFKIDVKKVVSDLSVAEKQMLEIAKVLAAKPDILILDEPTATLEEHDVQVLFEVIRSQKNKGVSVIYISHRLEEIFEIADRVTVLKDGMFVGCKDVAETDERELVRMMVGRDIEQKYPERQDIAHGDVVLSVRHLYTQAKLRDVSFELRRGEILGFAGLVGSGRTEVARCIFGVDDYIGEIIYKGQPLRVRSPKDAINKGIAYLTEDRQESGLFLDMSTCSNLTAAALGLFSRAGVIQRRKELSAAKDMIRKLSIDPPSPERKVKQLSGGNQQKVALGKWLLMDCDVIILDQPTWGVDVGTTSEIFHLMSRLAAQGKAIMYISNSLPDLINISDRIVVMRDGAIAAQLASVDATEEIILTYAIGGNSHET